jgi:hypothetical protein
VFLFSITANAQEKTIISFQTKNGKTMKLSLRQKDNAIIYRLYNKDKIEMQYPKIPSFSENKNFSFTYLNRFGGNINEATSLYRIKFFKMLTKDLVKEQIESFPNQFSIDELFEKLIVIDKIEKGIEQSDNEDTISEEELDFEIKKWFE